MVFPRGLSGPDLSHAFERQSSGGLACVVVDWLQNIPRQFTFAVPVLRSSRWAICGYRNGADLVQLLAVGLHLIRGGPMPSKLSSKRSKAFSNQSTRCFYCGYQMWLVDPEAFAKRLEIAIRQTTHLRCTVEHLDARCDGGSDAATNIAAACWICNSRRHRRKIPLNRKAFRELVSRRIECGRWHHKSLRCAA